MEDGKPHLRRVLGRADLTLFLIAALVNLNSVPVVAGIGPAALLFWLAGFLLFFLPQIIAVLELFHRFPQEGGIYRWSKIAFGDFHGFVSGWCYWTNNIFYVPTLLFYIVGFCTFIGGDATRSLGQNPLFMAGVSLGLLWLITWLNVRGFSVGKWVQTVGVGSTLATTAVILGIGIVVTRSSGMATPLDTTAFSSALGEWSSIALLSVVCLNYVGLELASVIGEEVKDPLRSLPRAALVAGGSTVLLYILATFALQASVPAAEIGVIDGILQGVERAAGAIGMAWIVAPIAVLMSLNAAGNTSAWLAGSSRVPFVIGIDRYLPSAFGRIHPRHATPHIALVVQSFASSLFILINAVGTTVHDMYMILLQTTIILQLIPYLYMFAALLRVRLSPARYGGGEPYFRSTAVCVSGAILGFVMTAAGLILAFIPSHGVTDVLNFEMKILLGTFSFLIPAVLLYRFNAKRARTRIPIPAPVEAHVEVEVEALQD